MSVTNYRRYVRDTLALAKSLTIKSELSIIEINQFLKDLGHPVSDDPYTWRYYLHLAGEYHKLDTPMDVRSLDTREMISFDRETLKTHLVTKENYAVGTRFYRTLVERFPDQEMLIRGILNPVDIQKAVEAPDFTILWADESLIESNETNLIDELQKRINEFDIRWNIPAYSEHDDLYTTASLAVLFSRLPGWIQNIRLENCKTRYVHGFHVKEYLKSHGRLDRHYDYLTKAQSLWLYRNLLYLERNAGKQETFQQLLDQMLTYRGMGLARYTTTHNLSPLPENIRPEPELLRQGLNDYHRSFRKEEHSLKELLIKERDEAVRNRNVEEVTEKEGSRKIQNAGRNTLRTKALESAVIDWTESGVVTRTNFLVNHWAYWSATGKYKSIIRVLHPRTGEQMELKAEDAFILFLYCLNRTYGVELTTVPGFTAQCIRRIPTPSFSELRGIVSKKWVSDELVQIAANSQAYDASIYSPPQFSQVATGLFDEFYDHRDKYSLQETSQARGQVQGLFDHLYMDVDTPLTDLGMDLKEWSALKGLVLTELTELECDNLSLRLLEESTGIRFNTTDNPGAIQKAMLSIMEQLSSYNIQYLQEINPGPINFWEWPVIRVGKIGGHGKSYQRAELLSHTISDAHFKGNLGLEIDFNRVYQRDYGVKGRLRYHHDVKTRFVAKEFRSDHLRLPLARAKMTVKET